MRGQILFLKYDVFLQSKLKALCKGMRGQVHNITGQSLFQTKNLFSTSKQFAEERSVKNYKFDTPHSI